MMNANSNDKKKDSGSDTSPLMIEQNLPPHDKKTLQETQRFVTPEKLEIKYNHEFKHHMINTILFKQNEQQSIHTTAHEKKSAQLTPERTQEILHRNTRAHQIKRAQLTPEKKQEIQFRNTTARQIKRAHLTPEIMHEIQCKDRRAHQEKRAQMSLEIKQEIQSKNTRVHQEKRAKLPLKRKQKIQSKDTEAHQEKRTLLTLEQKREIQSKNTRAHQERRAQFILEQKREIQSKNTRAHQEKRAQLPLEEKQQIQSKDTRAHQENRAQLPLEEKQQIQSKDTRAHQEKRAQLPLEEKQQIQSKNTTAHQEKRAQLPLEQKQQIQSKNRRARQKNRAQLPLGRKQEIQSNDTRAHQDKRGYDTDQLEWLCNDIIWQTEVDATILECVRQHYTKHPNLALFYYYCCTTNPESLLRNDDLSSEMSRNIAWNRISNAIGPPIGQQEAIVCQTKAEEIACSNNKISFCASCCERIVQDQEKNVIIETHIDKLHKSFLLTEEQAKQMHLLKKEVLEAHVMMLQHNGKLFHLNPDLVLDKENIILCQICDSDPLENDFSIANGHDYGRRGSLPSLSTTTLNAIIPFRCFNINIKLMANHSTGHSIVFPCDGPVETAKVLPCYDIECRPQITFLGPKDSWRKNKHLYKYLYELDVEGAYQWLNVWKELRNPHYKDIAFDHSDEMKSKLARVTTEIETDAVLSEAPEVINMAEMIQKEEEEEEATKFNVNIHETLDTSSPLIVHSAVLPKPSLVDLGVNMAVEALCQIIQPTDDEVGEQRCDTNQLHQNIVSVSRSPLPVDEWTQNEVITGGAFPHLFMLGKGVPSGTITAKHWKHYALFYDGRFDDKMFISHGFNQLQRFSCIRKTATISAKQLKQLESLSILANSDTFKQQLTWARDNPFTKEAKILNAKVCRALSMVGSTVPYSPFERSATRSKLYAHRYRYGMASFFITGAPPEFEDNLTLRSCIINKWNDPTCEYSKEGCLRSSLPTNIIDNASVRLRMCKQRPLLCALFFHNKLKILLDAVIGCTSNTDRRRNLDFLQHRRHAFGQIASLNGVIEPQVDGRLHWHINLFSSVINPSLLTQLSSAPQRVINQVGEYIDSIVCTKLPAEMYEWYKSVTQKDNNSTKTVRAADLSSPTAGDDFALFMDIAKKKGILSGIHGHGFTCQKLPKGRYQCRVSMPRGVHEESTGPIVIVMNCDKDEKKGNKRPTFAVFEVNEQIKHNLSASRSLGQGQLCHDHFGGPIVWEQQRFECDAYFVEQNLLTTMLIQCHNNASFISGRDAGEAVEEYLISYFGKEAAPLKQAAGVLLAAMEHIHAYPSKADDKNTPARNAKHLAQRTINSFSGGHQWSLPLMCSALLGHRSHISSDNYRYIFAHDNVNYVDSNLDNCKFLAEPPSCSTETTAYVNGCLDALLAAADNNESKGETSGGTTSYNIKDTGKVIFLTQSVSYANRGDNFKYYSQLEFECIVELVEKRNIEKEECNKNKGRPKRIGFDLGENHPLYTTHQGVIRCKMLTPILAGKPPPKFPGNRPVEGELHRKWHKEMEYFAKYMLDMIVPWCANTTPLFPRDSSGFCTMAESWNSKTAPFICQQRYQYISNIMEKSHRNSKNEIVVGAWRERNCDRWSEMKDKNIPLHVLNPNAENETPIGDDLELRGLLSADETYQFTVAITNPDVMKKLALQNISETYRKVFAGLQDQNLPTHITLSNLNTPIFMQFNNTLTDHETCTSLLDMRTQIRLLSESLLEMQVNVHPISLPQGNGSVVDNSLHSGCSHNITNDDIYKGLTDQQIAVLNSLITTEKQQLIFMHGGGGTGKTYVTCRLVATLASRNQFCCCTCPTGVGASHLPGGRTFHSIFRTWLPSLSASHCIDEIARDLRGMQLRVLMIDEVSMLISKFLVLLDNRLRSIYNPSVRFGGVSILLSGDFVQLPVIGGNDLWAVMYGEVSGEDATARDLFSQFQVHEMTQQMRAAKCVDHRRRLEQFRVLPNRYPTGDKWRAVDIAEYTPINDDIIGAITKELSVEDVMKNPGWISDATVLVSGNTDRAIINATAAIMFGQREGKQVYFWKRQLVKGIPSSLQSMLYDQKLRPLLFQYFVEGAPAQVLDNNNGNVSYGVANGTSCKLVSMAWDEKDKEDEIIALISKNIHSAILQLPYPPDHIIVSITPKPGTTWPRNLNLAPPNSDSIHIPIGLVSRIDNKTCVRLSKGLKLMYYKHAVDLAFAMSVWKGQGSTYAFLLALLEMSPGERRLTFEMLYVMFSRVQESDNFRCLPLSKAFDRRTLYNLRPSIGATRWRMDIGEDGLWRPNVQKKNQKCGKRFVSNTTIALRRNKNEIDSQLKVQIPIRLPLNGVKKKINTATSNSSSVQAPKQELLHFSNSTQSLSIQHQRDEVSNYVRTLFDQKWNVYISDLDCLQNGRWLDEHVIMMFLDHEHQNHENILLCDFSIYNSWLERTLQFGISYHPSEIMSDFILHNMHLYQLPLWIIPIHENHHYQLLIIGNPSLHSRTFCLLDSMKNPSQEIRNVNHLKHFIKCLLQTCSSVLLHETDTFDVNDLHIIYPRVHQQPNSFDCGVYAILNGIYAMKNSTELLGNTSVSLNLTHWYTANTGKGYRWHLQTVTLQQIQQTQLCHPTHGATRSLLPSLDNCPHPTFIEDCGTAWRFISGDVINYFFRLMMEKYPQIKAQPTYFFQQLSNDNDWSTYLQRRIIDNRCPNHENLISGLQDKDCITILPMGANYHWTVLVKKFVIDVWKIQYADSITSNSASSMSSAKRVFLNTPVCLNNEPVIWQNIHLQPQTEYECGARLCVAAVFLSLVDNNVLLQRIRSFNQIENLSQKSRDMVRSICINKTFTIPLWLSNVIYG